MTPITTQIQRSLLIAGCFLGVACLIGCGNSHLAAAGHLADVAIAEAAMPEREVVTIDHMGDQMRSWELDTRGHELIPPVDVAAAVEAALEALGSADDEDHDFSRDVLNQFTVPVKQIKPAHSESVHTPSHVRRYRAKWQAAARTWWNANREGLRFYRKLTDAPPGDN